MCGPDAGARSGTHPSAPTIVLALLGATAGVHSKESGNAPALPDEFDPRKLSSEFRHFDLDVLSVCNLHVVARKAKHTQGFRDGA